MKTIKLATARVVAATLLAASIATSFQASAGNLVDVEVLARAGRYQQAQLPSYYFGGQEYVEGVSGQEFRVRLNNRSGERVLVVLSVDGINAISGQNANVQQTGYVLNPYQSLDVDGWRKSANRTAAFYFTNIGDSYGARTGRPDNVGVIGAAVFREQRAYGYQAPPQIDYEYGRNQDKSYEPNRSADAGSGAVAESKSLGRMPAPSSAPLGAGHGRNEYSPSMQVRFEREGYVYETVNVRYDSRQNLIAMGVIPRDYGHYGYNEPQAFPERGYAPDPVYRRRFPR
jgi:hypothetical protein